MRKLLAAPAAAAAAVLIAACGPSSSHAGAAHSAAAKAKSNVSAMATNPVVQGDVKKAEGYVQACLAKTNTPYYIIHFVKRADAAYVCLKAHAANPATLKTRIETILLTNGIGKGAETKDVTQIATALVTP